MLEAGSTLLFGVRDFWCIGELGRFLGELACFDYAAGFPPSVPPSAVRRKERITLALIDFCQD